MKDDKKNFDRVWNTDVLAQEFEIVKPDGIIALGHDAERYLHQTGIGITCQIRRVYHFAIIHNVYQWGDRTEASAEFRRDFTAAVEAYRSSKTP